jgi:hypothetical protein
MRQPREIIGGVLECWSNGMMPRMVILFFVCWLFAGEDATAAQPVKVRISYSSRSNSNTPFQVAVDKGFF